MKSKKLGQIQVKGTTYYINLIKPNNKYYGKTNTFKKVIDISSEKTAQKETIAHELLHTYFHECGHDELCNNENLHRAFGRFAVELIKNYNNILTMLERSEQDERRKKNLELYKQLKAMQITLCDYFIHYGKLLKEQPHNARYLYIKMRISKLIRMISEFRKGMRINNIIVNSKGEK